MRPKPWAVAACGHGIEVSDGRCWDCHLAHLRENGAGERADRLVMIRRQHDEGRFDYAALLRGLAGRLMDELPSGAEPEVPRKASRLRHGRPQN